MRNGSLIAIVCLLLPACASLGEPKEPLAGVSEAHSEPSEATNLPVHHALSPQAAAVQVYPGDDAGFDAEVVQVLDFHTAEKSEDKGFDLLREKAAELGGTAVIEAQFEHGEGNEPSHLSGMAVKPRVRDERPYVVIKEIDIATPEDDDDKGFDRMRAEALACGADKVVNVKFDHGAEGGMSHLTGKAVKYVK
jgi:uncharacterized protein YbjQ (UPF0145 family)